MSLEKPWEKPFDKLLEMLNGLWAGEIKDPENCPDNAGFRAAGQGFYNYPWLTTDVKGYKLVVEISEFPMSDSLLFDGDDNVEFLRIHVVGETDYDMLIRHERITDKVMKLIGLETEHQTGDDEFDKRYFLVAKTDQGKSLLRSKGFQKLITGLEPFATVRIMPRDLCWSQEIRRKSQLDYEQVQVYITRLLDLMKAVEKES